MLYALVPDGALRSPRSLPYCATALILPQSQRVLQPVQQWHHLCYALPILLIGGNPHEKKRAAQKHSQKSYPPYGGDGFNWMAASLFDICLSACAPTSKKAPA